MLWLSSCGNPGPMHDSRRFGNSRISLTTFPSRSNVFAVTPCHMNSKRILAFGEDALVISTRAMILQRAGYDVAHTTRIIDVLPLLHGIFFDLLLIGDSIRMHQNVRLVQSVREQFPALLIAKIGRASCRDRG